MEGLKLSIFRKAVFVYLVFLVLFFISPSSIFAGTVSFDPATSSTTLNGTFSVTIKIDAGTDQVAGTDIYVTYDDTLVDLQSVTGAGYFPLVSNIPSTGRLYISGVVANQGEFKTGVGSVATLVFKGVSDGTAEFIFDCDLTKTSTSKIVKNDINASNVIDCSGLNTHSATIGSGADTSDNATSQTTPTSLPASGVFDSFIKYSYAGGILVVVGILARLLLRI